MPRLRPLARCRSQAKGVALKLVAPQPTLLSQRIVEQISRQALAGVGVCISVACLVAYPTANADNGPTMVRTESGKVRCSVSVAEVTCQRQSGGTFPGSPYISGYAANQASVRPSGSFQWFSAQLPAIEQYQPQYDTVLTYQRILRLNGWTIEPTYGGTKFTNEQTGRGMFVSTENVINF